MSLGSIPSKLLHTLGSQSAGPIASSSVFRIQHLYWLISPSKSPWASPTVIVQKRDGSTRFCVDYRKINKVTRKDAYPIPRIDETLDTLAGATLFSTLDLRSGYWQVAMDPTDRDKTVFCTPEELFEFISLIPAPLIVLSSRPWWVHICSTTSNIVS